MRTRVCRCVCVSVHVCDLIVSPVFVYLMIVLHLKADEDSRLLKVTNPNKRKLESEVKTEVKEDAEEEWKVEEEEGEDELLFTYPMDRENKQVRGKAVEPRHHCVYVRSICFDSL